MTALTPLQWAGVALLAVGAVWWLAPSVVAWIASRRRVVSLDIFDDAEALADRMARLAQLQTDLEARGHGKEADLAGGWYSLMRDPIQQEAPSP